MTGPAPAITRTGWDADAFARAFPLDRADGLRPRPGADAALSSLGAIGRAWHAGEAVTAELPRGASLADLVSAARALRGVVDAVVLQEPVDSSLAAPAPSHAAIVLAAIAPVIVVLSPRERNRVALEGEVAALADAGAAIVVTDGGGAAGGVHDLGQSELTALARRAGAAVGVVADPARDREPRRARHLGRSGAHVCLAVPADAGTRAAFARGVAEERGPRVVFGVAPGGTPLLDTVALPGFAGFHVWADPRADLRAVCATAERAREVLV